MRSKLSALKPLVSVLHSRIFREPESEKRNLRSNPKGKASKLGCPRGRHNSLRVLIIYEHCFSLFFALFTIIFYIFNHETAHILIRRPKLKKIKAIYALLRNVPLHKEQNLTECHTTHSQRTSKGMSVSWLSA